MKNQIKIISLILLVALISGCSVYKTVMNVSRLKYKLNNVSNITVAGVNVAGKLRVADFSLRDGMSLTAAFSRGSLPISFTLNIAAVNPNNGTGGYARTDATIKAFPYRLLIDGKEILSGNLSSPVSVPGTGEAVIIPVSISFDLFKSFKDKGYEGILNLAMNIAGLGNTPTTVQLYVKPTIKTVIGDLTPPSEIKVIEKEFTKQ